MLSVFIMVLALERLLLAPIWARADEGVEYDAPWLVLFATMLACGSMVHWSERWMNSRTVRVVAIMVALVLAFVAYAFMVEW